MKKYKIDKYNLAVDCGYCFEHKYREVVEAEALKLCSEDNGEYTYRMETWNGETMIGGWRFFQNGKEFTSLILDALTENKKDETSKEGLE